jgi:hypothetical protein
LALVHFVTGGALGDSDLELCGETISPPPYLGCERTYAKESDYPH